jgi:ribose/xylose/arabinose/galactoside ABC-type transport system permease subunit
MGSQRNRFSNVRQWVAENPAVWASMIFIVVLAIAIPSFGTMRNILTILQQMSIYGIAAVGLAYVLICGGNDLSIGSNITFSSITAALCMTGFFPQAGALGGVIAALLTGCVVGLINGIMVAKVGINPFMMTLIMSMLLDGLSILATNGTAIGGLPEAYKAIGSYRLLFIPIPLWILLIFYVVGQFVLKKTAVGRKIYASGANVKAAKLVGVKTEKTLIGAFIFCGVCSSVSGVIMSARLAAATTSAGSIMMLDIISAALIGGCSLFGGKGSVVGAAAGVLLLSLISNGLNLLNVDHNVTMIVKGVIILIAVLLDASQGTWSSRKILTFKRNTVEKE